MIIDTRNFGITDWGWDMSSLAPAASGGDWDLPKPVNPFDPKLLKPASDTPFTDWMKYWSSNFLNFPSKSNVSSTTKPTCGSPLCGMPDYMKYALVGLGALMLIALLGGGSKSGGVVVVK